MSNQSYRLYPLYQSSSRLIRLHPLNVHIIHHTCHTINRICYSSSQMLYVDMHLNSLSLLIITNYSLKNHFMTKQWTAVVMYKVMIHVIKSNHTNMNVNQTNMLSNHFSLVLSLMFSTLCVNFSNFIPLLLLAKDTIGEICNKYLLWEKNEITPK